MAFVERVQDTLAVQKFFVLYARAVDTRDWADTDIIVYSLYESLFTEDAVLDYASGMMLAGVNWSDAVCGNRKKAVTWISANFKQNFGKTQHLISNIDIEWDGNDAAHVRAMFYNPLTLRGLPLTRFITVGGWYIHELVRCPDGKWRSKFLRQEIAFFSLFMGVLQYGVIGLLLAYLLWKA